MSVPSWLTWVLVILAAGAGLMIGIMNPDQVTFDLLVTTWTTTTGMLFSVAILGGVFAGALLMWLARVLPLRFQLRRLRRQGGGAGGRNNDHLQRPPES